MNRKKHIFTFVTLFAIFVAIWGVCHLSSLLAVCSALLSLAVPVIAGGCIAFILNIPMRFFERIWINRFGAKAKKLRRAVCLIITLLLFAAVIALLLGLIIPQVWKTVENIGSHTRDYIDKAWGWYASFAGFLERFSVSLPPLNINTDEIVAKVAAFISENSHRIIDMSVNIATTAFSAVFDTVVSFVIAIYILLQKEKLSVQAKKLLYSMLSEKNTERVLAFARLTEKTFSGFVTGQLTEAFIIGILCFVGMLIFKMPYAPLISLMVGVTALIPIFGAFIGTGIGAFLILFESPLKALMFVVFIIVLQQLEGNIIYPRVVGSQVGLPGLWVLIAVTVGSEFGVFGMLISVPIASLLYSVTRQIVNARIKEKGLEGEFPEEEPKKQRKKRVRRTKKSETSSAEEKTEE